MLAMTDRRGARVICEQWGAINVAINMPATPAGAVILAHGAGAGMTSPFMALLADQIAAQGIVAVRFEFPYMAKRSLGQGKPPPNRMPILLATWAEVIARGQSRLPRPLAIGGKSMGGRAATEFLATDDCAPLAAGVAFGYPFHPPGQPLKTRTDHLPRLQRPLQILQGTRDPFGRPEEVAGYNLGPRTALVWLASGDHDFKPLKSSGCAQADLITKAAATAAAFIKAQETD